jgi:hypothetical protein
VYVRHVQVPSPRHHAKWVSGSNATKTCGKARGNGETVPTTRLLANVRTRSSVHGKDLYHVAPCEPRIVFGKDIMNSTASICSIIYTSLP